MQNKKQPKHDDMRIVNNKKQYTNIANRDLLRSFCKDGDVQQKDNNVTRKDSSEPK